MLEYSNRATDYNSNSSLEKHNVVLLEIFNYHAIKIVDEKFSIESVEKVDLLKLVEENRVEVS